MSRFIRSLVVALLLACAIAPSASAGPTGITGRITADAGTAIAGVTVKASQGSKVIATSKSSADGSYRLDVPTGAYTLSMTSPTPAYGSLLAYDVVVPMAQNLNIMLTKPMPGRAFVTGLFTAPGLSNMKSNITFELGSSAIGDPGNFRITPTAGASSTIKITGTALTGAGKSFEFKFQQATPFKINQDTYLNLPMPIGSQRFCVVTAEGKPAPNTQVRVGMGYLRAPAGTSAPLDALGPFTVAYQVDAQTDPSGCASVPVITTARPTAATFSITPPATLGYDSAWIDATVGNGPLTFTLRNPVSSIKGTVKDQAGVPFVGTQMIFMEATGGTWAATGADGSYTLTRPSGSVGKLSGSWSGEGVMAPLSWKFTSNSTTTVGASTTANVVVSTDTTQVTVTDQTGQPVSNVGVYLSLSGPASLGSDVPSAALQSTSVAYTDARGVARLRSARLTAATAGQTLTVDPPRSTGLAWTTLKVTAGQGAPLAVTLAPTTVRMTGRITTSDGSPVLPSIAWGDSNSMSSAVDANGNYVITKLKGGTDRRWITGTFDSLNKVGFSPSLMGSTKITATSDVVQDFVIPTYKTRVQVVDPSGKPLPNVLLSMTVGEGMGNPNGSLTWVPGEGPYTVRWSSRATTDASGWASLTSITTASPLPAYLLLTPDPTSRYQMRNVTITVGDGAQNVIVLTIPKPIVNSAALVTSGDIRTVSVIGLNFLGTISVSVGATPITRFTVVDDSTITFDLPVGTASGAVTVTNGGGSATSATSIG